MKSFAKFFMGVSFITVAFSSTGVFAATPGRGPVHTEPGPWLALGHDHMDILGALLNLSAAQCVSEMQRLNVNINRVERRSFSPTVTEFVITGTTRNDESNETQSVSLYLSQSIASETGKTVDCKVFRN